MEASFEAIGGRGVAAEIRFVCRAQKHQHPAKPSMPTSPVTYHDGAWAYCASGAAADHQWEAVDAMSLEEIRTRINVDTRLSASKQPR
jgi:hypothetical protein